MHFVSAQRSVYCNALFACVAGGFVVLCWFEVLANQSVLTDDTTTANV
jgi:hypothetical protein